jgi:hypothetical protein
MEVQFISDVGGLLPLDNPFDYEPQFTIFEMARRKLSSGALGPV